MEDKVNAIVLSAVSYGENDKILTLFTLEKGVKSAKIKGVKKAGAKLKFASEPFCFSEYVLSVRGEYSSVINASMHDSFYSLREDVKKYYSASAVMEFIKRNCPEGVESKSLFFLTAKTLEELTYSTDTLPVMVNFMVQALKEIGYGVLFDGCGSCGGEIGSRAFFDFTDGNAYCLDCAPESATEISVHTYNVLKKVSLGEKVTDAVYLKRAYKLLLHYLTLKTDVHKVAETYLTMI